MKKEVYELKTKNIKKLAGKKKRTKEEVAAAKELLSDTAGYERMHLPKKKRKPK